MKNQTLFKQFHALIDNEQAQFVLENVNLFFIVGLGRSGTTFLSQLLKEVSRCAIYHETKRDGEALTAAYWNIHQADYYLSTYRERLMAWRILRTHCETYGEVNSYLRYHVKALQKRYQPQILHLVRDGRHVVTSIMNRHTFTPSDAKHSGRICPHPGTPYAEQWDSMDRFARVCWYWAETNQYLVDCQLPLVRFEDVISSYECFSHQVLKPLGIDVPTNIWTEQVNVPKNESKTRVFKDWNSWTPRQKQQFEEICGEVMVDLNYIF
ncbi:MAG: sulfotransferase [Anaerolineae bacterium]|nr:sulfotransferase [Anaerolineae bacterium]